MRSAGLFAAGTLVAAALVGGSCSSGPKKTTPELSAMEGKKVALVEIEGEATARSVSEVALINQLVSRGTFILVSKQDVEAARQHPGQDPTDWVGIARRAGADFALKGKILEFTGDTRQGYSTVEERDSQLAEDRGDDGKTERLIKVRALHGKVRIQLQFSPTARNDLRTGTAEAEDEVTADTQTEAAHLPPKLRFLEKIANEAFRKFFEQYK
jgi:hypothetical protein